VICYIKVELLRKYTMFIRNHPKLDFKGSHYDRTGEAFGKLEAEYKGLKFIIKRGKVFIRGSLHYFYNDGVHNYDDFTLLKLFRTLKRLENLFGIDLTEAKLLNLEFGVNIRLNFKAYLVLRNLLFHVKKVFKDEVVDNGKGDYRVLIHSDYRIKIYDKGLHFGLPYELLRYELHYNVMRDLKEMGVECLSNLKKLTVLEKLKIDLLKKWDELFLYDWTIDISKVKEGLYKDFYNWGCPYFWTESVNKSNRYKNKSKYNAYVQNYAQNVKKEIRDLIDFKLNLLLNKKATFSSY